MFMLWLGDKIGQTNALGLTFEFGKSSCAGPGRPPGRHVMVSHARLTSSRTNRDCVPLRREFELGFVQPLL